MLGERSGAAERTRTRPGHVVQALREARQRTLELIADLSDDQIMGPRLAIVNPMRWEVGHVGWFQEHWLLNHFSELRPIRDDAEALYDSMKVHHDTRWDLPLPSRDETLKYIQRVLDRVVEEHESGRLSAHEPVNGFDSEYFLHLTLFHECMHAEAFTYTRQTLGYAEPRIGIAASNRASSYPDRRAELLGDAFVPGGGRYVVGGSQPTPFIFDNEEGGVEVDVAPFHIARTAVSNGEFADFVADGGYARPELWTPDGWQWRVSASAQQPRYWRASTHGGWERRNFDTWVRLELAQPVLHVNWHEASAYCRWAGRRLPSEAEWEMAASAEPTPDGQSISQRRRMYTWGDESPTPDRANLDWRQLGCVDVDALPAGDSAFGCRQMIGNTWEWTSTDFGPFPGFKPGPYKDYSEPWFGDHKVLRGGCWATRSSLIRNRFRNFYKPDRGDVWAGFRTCAL